MVFFRSEESHMTSNDIICRDLFAGIVWSRLKPLVMSFPEVWHGRGASVWVDTINTPIFFTSRHSLSSHRHGYPWGGIHGYPTFWDPVDLWYSVTAYWDITKGRRGSGMYSNYSGMVTTFLWHPCGSAQESTKTPAYDLQFCGWSSISHIPFLHINPKILENDFCGSKFLLVKIS